MFYLSQALGAPLEDQRAVRIGKIVDVLVEVSQVGRNEATYPSALLVVSDSDDEHHWRLPGTALAHQPHGWRLLLPIEQFPAATSQPAATEFSMASDVLDRQVIDVEQKKAIRVSDVCFGDDWQILGIDHTTAGLLRRLAPAWLTGLKKLPSTFLPWHRIEPLASQASIEVAAPPIPSGHLTELHPADIASIVHQLTAEQGARVLERLDHKLAADTMEEIETERQGSILENMQPELATLILQEMGPDEIADLLARVPDDRREQLLHRLNPEESEDVQELLAYEADTAGGLMTTDYIGLSTTHTVQEALETIRAEMRTNDTQTAYIYCVTDEYRLLGVVSIWHLLLAHTSQTLLDIMQTDMVMVTPDTDPQTVAETMATYNLLALPVVTEDGTLAGIVTVDDALDILLPDERRRKPRRMY